MKTVNVKLDSASYSICISRGGLTGLGNGCRGVGLSGLAAVITNPLVGKLYGAVVRSSLEDAGFRTFEIEIPDGEEYKNSGTLNQVYDRLIEGAVDRKSFIVALGGGVVGDLAGFAAATYLRGIPFVQVPTTLLAQVDSSVGGKTGIDHQAGKNLIGAFHQPRLVVTDPDTLKTVEERHYLAGLAEVVKYGVVLDLQLFELLEQNVDSLLRRDPDLLGDLIARCCSLKGAVVEQDEKESGLRAVLNYGHTLGHAFELLSGYSGLLHGEAVAIGMALAAAVSERAGYCSSGERERIVQLLKRLGLPVLPPQFERGRLLDALCTDKKNLSGHLKFVCNSGIGAYTFQSITADALVELAGCGVDDRQELIELTLADMADDDGNSIEPPPLSSALTTPPPVLKPSSTLAVMPITVPLTDLTIQTEATEQQVTDEEPLMELAEQEVAELPPIQGEDPLTTSTLAELYSTQGFHHKALDIYRKIVAAEPHNMAAAARLAELEQLQMNSMEVGQEAEQAVSGESESSSVAVDSDKAVVATLEGWLENIQRLRLCH